MSEAPPLLAIGFWKERLDDELPFPMEVEGALDPAARQAVANYLDAGTVIERYRGYSYCRYGCEGLLGSAELSDGDWLWPEGYGHYVRTHGVIAPPEFLEHVSQACASPRRRAPTPRNRDVSGDMWISWGATRRTSELTLALETATREARLRCDEALRVIADEQEVRFGVSEVPCLSVGCTRPVLCGRLVCANCVAEERRNFELQKCEYLLIREIMRDLVARDQGSR